MDETGDETQDGQRDVDEEVDAAAALEEDTQGREDDGKDNFADVAVRGQFSASLQIDIMTASAPAPPCPSSRHLVRTRTEQPWNDARTHRIETKLTKR